MHGVQLTGASELLKLWSNYKQEKHHRYTLHGMRVFLVGGTVASGLCGTNK